MSILNNINGVWRDSQPLVNINGVWREAETYTNINGVWRPNTNKIITESDIIGFKIIYSQNPDRVHPIYTELKHNPKIPARLYLSDDSSKNMDFNIKTVRCDYGREYVKLEGKLVYDAKLYAILINDIPIDIGNVNYTTSSEIGIYNKNIDDMIIQIDASNSYESNGLFFSGWNSIFTTDQLIADFNYPDKTEDEIYNISDYNMLPINSRDKDFYPVACIGIARDMHSPVNMVGSFGILRHTYTSIKVNGVPKPFVVEVYR